MPTTSQPVRVIIRIPRNRPTEGSEDPPKIEWNAEKENILWEVIARSRAIDSGGTDWQGLAAHLQVPLPYLLYRAQTRYEEDLRGLQALLPPGTQPTNRTSSEEAKAQLPERPELVRKLSVRTTGLNASTKLVTPSSVRARLTSLGFDSAPRHSKASSSSTVTLQGVRHAQAPSHSPPPLSDYESESDEEAEKAEEEERRQEKQAELEKKLKRLQAALTADALGLVRDARPKTKGKEPERGREGPKSPASPSPLRQSFRTKSLSTSSYNSASSSPQGSIPSIPSPSDSQPQSPIPRHIPHGKKSQSPPAISSGQARGQSHMQFRNMVGVAVGSDRGSSTHGSTASSFSDISDASLSASALESAVLSNIRGASSRFSTFARSQFARRAPSGGVLQ